MSQILWHAFKKCIFHTNSESLRSMENFGSDSSIFRFPIGRILDSDTALAANDIMTLFKSKFWQAF